MDHEVMQCTMAPWALTMSHDQGTLDLDTGRCHWTQLTHRELSLASDTVSG